jgi:hypothetical protein
MYEKLFSWFLCIALAEEDECTAQPVAEVGASGESAIVTTANGNAG